MFFPQKKRDGRKKKGGEAAQFFTSFDVVEK